MSPVVGTRPFHNIIPIFTIGASTTTNNTWVRAASLTVDLDNFLVGPNSLFSVKFVTVARVTQNGTTGAVRIFNATDNVVIGTIPYNEVTPTLKTLDIGADVAGSGFKMYEIQYNKTAGAAGQGFVLVSAVVDVLRIESYRL